MNNLLKFILISQATALWRRLFKWCGHFSQKKKHDDGFLLKKMKKMTANSNLQLMFSGNWIIFSFLRNFFFRNSLKKVDVYLQYSLAFAKPSFYFFSWLFAFVILLLAKSFAIQMCSKFQLLLPAASANQRYFLAKMPKNRQALFSNEGAPHNAF